MIALSTSWNMHKHTTGYEVVKEIKELGFNKMEISCYWINEKKLNEIVELIDKGEIEAVSMHNFCPNPIYDKNQEGGGGIFSLTADDKEEVNNALKFTKKTIETAKRASVKVVILHTGEVRSIEEEVKTLFHKLKKYGNNSFQYKSYLESLIEKRNKNRNIYLERALTALETLNEYAKKLDILLAVENRYYFHEIPDLEEIGIILNHFNKNSNIYYWHDTGHAQVNEIIGVAPHIDYFKNYKDRMIGIHLHDIQELKDHRAPTFGEMAFAMIKENIPQDCIKVMELHRGVKKEELRIGYEYLKTLL